MLYLAGVLFVILCVIYFVFVRPFTYWTNNQVPQYKFWEIWLRNTSDAIRQPPLVDAMMKLYKDFPDNRYIGTYQLFVPKLCIRDPELIKQIFVKDFDHFVDHTMFIPTDGDPVWEKSLFSLRGKRMSSFSINNIF
ncbi:hypothetical protein ILUMI_04920 [Ignelater luminosus]|uniref:Cytochrome P450 n=1 Tax=Ignelater luminosus TaxID=2038154 RepID=A0A8K0DDW8_IGNLU|nr:hypothetical protein ILUMI_04920 [Ignelater luminosus]